MRFSQRVRGGGSRIDNGLEQWAPEGEGKADKQNIKRQKVFCNGKYLRRESCVSGKECVGTLQEVGLF